MPEKDIDDILPMPERMEGRKVEKNDIVNQKLTIVNFSLLPSSYEGTDHFSVIQAKLNNEFITFSGGSVLTKKLQAIGHEGLPFRAKLSLVKGKQGRSYFDFLSAK